MKGISDGKNSKRLSFGHALKMALHMLKDNLFRAVLTVLLLSVCCAAVGMSLAAYGQDTKGVQIEVFRTYEGSTVALSRFNWFGFNGSVGVRSNSMLGISMGDVSDLEEQFSEKAARLYLMGYSQVLDNENYHGLRSDTQLFQQHWFYGDYDRHAAAVRNNEVYSGAGGLTYMEEYLQKYPAETDVHYPYPDMTTRTYSGYCVLPEADLSEFGLTLLAGELPEADDEVAINNCMLEEFILHDYYLYEDVEAGEIVLIYYKVPNGSQSTYEAFDGISWILNVDEAPSIDPARVQEVNSAEDMIGKRIAVVDREQRYRLMTVTGVVDTGCNAAVHEEIISGLGDRAYFGLEDKLFVSEAWAEKYCPDGCNAVVFPRPTEDEEIWNYLDLMQYGLDVAYRNHALGASLSEDIDYVESMRAAAYAEAGDPIAIAGERDLLRQTSLREQLYLLSYIVGGAGAVLAVLGVLLCANLISSSVEKNRYALGVLKALGARNADIQLIYLLQCLLLGVFIFVLGMAGVTAFLYWVVDLTVAGIRLISVRALHVIVMALFAFVVPAAVGALSVRSVLRGSPIDITLSRKERRELKKGGK